MPSEQKHVAYLLSYEHASGGNARIFKPLSTIKLDIPGLWLACTAILAWAGSQRNEHSNKTHHHRKPLLLSPRIAAALTVTFQKRLARFREGIKADITKRYLILIPEIQELGLSIKYANSEPKQIRTTVFIQIGIVCPFTHSLGNQGRGMLHSFTPFKRDCMDSITQKWA